MGALEDCSVLTKEENDRFTRIGPGTPMGELFRRYWHPIAATCEMDQEPTKAVTILGESLVLYRDRGGHLGLIGDKCLHRRVQMVYGIPEEVGLRCPYHGWLYDHTGRCLEQPAEDMEAPDSTFKDRTIITAYPVQELGGLIFAYLGPKPAPLLPRWEQLLKEEAPSIGVTNLPCNWLQIMENSLDQTHVEWLHRRFDNYVLGRLGRETQQYQVLHHQKIGADVFEYGIVKRRLWEGGTENDPEWRIGHPILFPNILNNTGGGLQYRVPIDDEHTMHWWYPARFMPKDRDLKAAGAKLYRVPVPGLDENGHPTWDRFDNNLGQDMTMWYSQGPIADRSEEKLGTSDKPVILYRKLLDENMEIVARGDDPLGVIRDGSRNVSIHIPTEADEGGIAEQRIRQEANAGTGREGMG